MLLGAGVSGSFIAMAFFLDLKTDEGASSDVSLCSSSIFFWRVRIRSASSIFSIVIVPPAEGDTTVVLDASTGMLMALGKVGLALCKSG